MHADIEQLLTTRMMRLESFAEITNLTARFAFVT